MTVSRLMLLLFTALALGGCDVTSGGTGGGLAASTGMFGTGAGSGDGVMARAYAGSRSLLDRSRGAIKSAFDSSGADAPSIARPALTDRALNGLLGDRLGAVLDDGDRRFVAQAQLDALDRSAPGAPTPWRNPASGHSGIIVAGPFYERGDLSCRGFSHSITGLAISTPGGAESVRGTACRSAGGAWAAAG